MTMGLTLRRTARRINRLNGASTLILSGYAAPPAPRVPGALAVAQALQRLEGLLLDLEFPETPSELTRKVAKGVGEFETYIRNNEEFIPNFGERRRNGERISTAFVESTVNQVISKRMVKKQSMQWTPRGAHLLLQIRTTVLNNELDDVFRRWYPQFRPLAA